MDSLTLRCLLQTNKIFLLTTLSKFQSNFIYNDNTTNHDLPFTRNYLNIVNVWCYFVIICCIRNNLPLI